jgi:hypothetical protein
MSVCYLPGRVDKAPDPSEKNAQQSPGLGRDSVLQPVQSQLYWQEYWQASVIIGYLLNLASG